jgi:hypothetical protein
VLNSFVLPAALVQYETLPYPFNGSQRFGGGVKPPIDQPGERDCCAIRQIAASDRELDQSRAAQLPGIIPKTKALHLLSTDAGFGLAGVEPESASAAGASPLAAWIAAPTRRCILSMTVFGCGSPPLPTTKSTITNGSRS